jgi:hypothetical protein
MSFNVPPYEPRSQVHIQTTAAAVLHQALQPTIGYTALPVS